MLYSNLWLEYSNIVPGFYDDETAMMRKEDVDRVVHQYVAPM